MRRRVWLTVGVLAALIAEAGGVAYVIGQPRAAIREGMTLEEADRALGPRYVSRCEVMSFDEDEDDSGPTRFYDQVDCFGTERDWSVDFNSRGHVTSFRVKKHAFAARPPWLAAILKPLGL